LQSHGESLRKDGRRPRSPSNFQFQVAAVNMKTIFHLDMDAFFVSVEELSTHPFA